MQTPKGEIDDKIMKLTEDEEILKKMATATSPEECYDMVKDRLDGMSIEEFQASMSVVAAYVQESQSSELSEEDLDMVAGGKSDGERSAAWDKVGVGVGCVGGAVCVAAVAFSAL